MKKILMILTNARRDCCKLTLDLLERSGSYPVFDHVVFLLNGISDTHMSFVDDYISMHPGIAWDKILGNGVRPQGIADMQNRCIEKYPDALYMKVDEDLFVPDGWAHRMVAAYDAHKDMDNLGLITPLLPNNAYGLHVLLTQFYPDLLAEFKERFGHEPDPTRSGSTWHSPYIAEWATRKFIDLKTANEEQRRRLETRDQGPEDGTQKSEVRSPTARIPDPASRIPYLPFPDSFSIGCIAYDYRLWQKMGGIPETDEPGWTAWITDNGHLNILDCTQIALHYSFFVQVEWLDRTSLLEDIRRINLPGTLTLAQQIGLHRAARVTRQIPEIVRRRLNK
jgi:hypothetical protein